MRRNKWLVYQSKHNIRRQNDYHMKVFRKEFSDKDVTIMDTLLYNNLPVEVEQVTGLPSKHKHKARRQSDYHMKSFSYNFQTRMLTLWAYCFNTICQLWNKWQVSHRNKLNPYSIHVYTTQTITENNNMNYKNYNYML